MAITVIQTYQAEGTPYGKQPGYERKYKVLGSEVEADILTAVNAAVPSTLYGFYATELRHSHLGGGVWEITVRYAVGDPDEQFTADTTGGTIHLEYSPETRAIYRNGEAAILTPADAREYYNGLIGVNEDKIDGVDIPSPVFNFTITKTWIASTLSTDYLTIVKDATGTVNATACQYTWRGQIMNFDAGELRFMGASISEADPTENQDAQIQIAYRFESSPNAVGISVGPITDIDKKGWEYAWVRSLPAVAATGFHTREPIHVVIERVHDESDFELLGLFTF